MARATMPQDRVSPRLLGALVSGAALGCAFPPLRWTWGIWVGLVPLLCVIARTRNPQHVWAYGYLAGLVFFLCTLHPLASAHSWAGWAAETLETFSARMSRQWWWMQALWVLFACGGAIFWGWWAYLLHRLAPAGGLRGLVLAPSLWIMLPEWGRAQGGFGFTWSCLGNATADLAAIRQLASVGGVWLLSGLIVLVNAALADACTRRRAQRWVSILAATGLLVAGWAWSTWSLRAAESGPALKVAVLQYHQERYSTQDFLETGLDRGDAKMARQAVAQQVDLLVFPESVAIGAVSLDGTASRSKPPEWQHARASWDAQMAALLAGKPTVAVVGLDTVQNGQDYNTLVAWSESGALGWYHKQRLVPFAEYRPNGWGVEVLRGREAYRPGLGSQLIKTPHAIIGGFICQEVLIPAVTRSSARDGATLLVSGGNDGVFGDPAVAEIHADAARIRAVETGRDLVRAMKSGVSAIIDAHGAEVARSGSAEPELLFGSVHPRTGLTPYVRFGNWVVWAAWGAWILAVAGARVRPRRLDRRRRPQV